MSCCIWLQDVYSTILPEVTGVSSSAYPSLPFMYATDALVTGRFPLPTSHYFVWATLYFLADTDIDTGFQTQLLQTLELQSEMQNILLGIFTSSVTGSCMPLKYVPPARLANSLFQDSPSKSAQRTLESTCPWPGVQVIYKISTLLQFNHLHPSTILLFLEFRLGFTLLPIP
jgi:hypothetical protein